MSVRFSGLVLVAALAVVSAPMAQADSLPPEVLKALAHQCAAGPEASAGFGGITPAEHMFALDTETAMFHVCDSPRQKDLQQNTTTNVFTLGPTDSVLASYGTVRPVTASGRTVDFGKEKDVRGWYAALVDLGSSGTFSWTWQQRECNTQPYCHTSTNHESDGRLVADSDPDRGRRLRIMGWLSQASPGPEQEPIFSASCDAACTGRDTPKFWVGIGLDNPKHHFRTLAHLGPYPIQIPAGTPLHFRLPIPAAIQAQLDSYLSASKTNWAEVGVETEATGPTYTPYWLLDVNSTGIFPPAGAASDVFSESLVRAQPSVTARSAAKARISATILPTAPGSRTLPVRLKARLAKQYRSVHVTLQLQGAPNAAAHAHFRKVGSPVKKTLKLKKGVGGATLSLPARTKRGDVVRVQIVAAGAGSTTRSTSAPQTVVDGW